MRRADILDLVGNGECGCEKCRQLLARTVDRLRDNDLLKLEDERSIPRFAETVSPLPR